MSPSGAEAYSTVAATYDPSNHAQLFAGANMLSSPPEAGFISGDGGASWSMNGIPLPGSAPNALSLDPGAAYDTGGSLYFSSMPFTATSTTIDSQVVVSKSADHGKTWMPAVTLEPAANAPEKPMVTVDTTAGLHHNRVYVAYDTNPSNGSQPVVVARSDDGVTWQKSQALGSGGGYGAIPAVGPGGEVYIAMDDWCGAFIAGSCSNPSGRILLSKSTDGGLSFSRTPAQVAATTIGSGVTVSSYSNDCYGLGPAAITPAPSLAVDRSGGVHSGTIYVAWADEQPAGYRLHTFLARSLDGGINWSPAVRLDPDNPQDAWQPSVAVDQSNGAVTVSWYDRRDDPTGKSYRIYYTQSTDGGASFLPHQVAVATSTSDPTLDCTGTGDYAQIVAFDGVAHPFWTDTRNGVTQIFTATVDEATLARLLLPPAHFATGSTYPVGGNPRTLAAGDLNGDGYLDLVVGNTGYAGVSVLLGQGNGSFVAGPSPTTNASRRSVALGDLNHDGHLDLITASSQEWPIEEFMGNGDGTFHIAPTQPSAPGASAVTMADINGDGNLDLVTTGPVDSVAISSGKGDGTFGAPVTYPGASYSVSVAVADLNNDGRPDIVAAGDSLAVLLQNPDHTFKAATSYGSASQSYVAIGDLNGDGHPDLAVTNFYGATISVLLNNGDGTFGTGTSYRVGRLPGGVAIGDVNRDGRPDIITGNLDQGEHSVSLLRGKGDGTFAPATSYATDAGSSAVVLGDFNRDQEADVAVANVWANNVSVILGDPSGLRAPVRYPGDQGMADLATGDLNGDGNTDVALTNTQAPSVYVYLGNGAGGLTGPTVFAAGSSPVTVAIADVSGTGRHDIVVGDPYRNTISVLLGSGDGTFGTPTTTNLPFQPIAIAVADFNGDKKADVAVVSGGTGVAILIGTGTGTFQAPVTYASIADARSLATADFNGDGKADLAVGSVASTAVAVLLGSGNGAFQAPVAYATNDGVRKIVTADFNNDHRVDMALMGGNAVSLLLGGGDGTFHPAGASPIRANPTSMTAADLNGDGKTDLAVVNSNGVTPYNTGTLSILAGQGDGTFGPPAEQTLSTPFDVGAADFNADGRVDLAVLSNALSPVSLMLRVGPRATIEPTGLTFPATPARSASPMRTLKVSNTGSDDLHIALAGLTGPDTADFSKLADHCSGATIDAGQSCTMDFAFTPRTVGKRTADVQIVDDHGSSPQFASLAGTGLIKVARAETNPQPPAPGPTPRVTRSAPPSVPKPPPQSSARANQSATPGDWLWSPLRLWLLNF